MRVLENQLSVSCQTTSLYAHGKKFDSQIYLPIFDNKSPLTDMHLFVSITFQHITSLWYVLFMNLYCFVYIAPFNHKIVFNCLSCKSSGVFNTSFLLRGVFKWEHFREGTDGELR